MGAGQSFVLAVPSVDFDADAALIRRVFGIGLSNQEGDGTEPNILVDTERNLTVILTESASPTNVTWVCEKDDLVLASEKTQVRREDFNEYPIAKVLLHGGNCIVMVTSDLVASRKGRSKLSEILMQTTAVDTPTSKEAVELLHSGTREATISPTTIGQTDELNPRPSFPGLDTRILQTNGLYERKLPINPIEPFEFETDLFKGKVLLLLRPLKLEDDSYWSERVFSKKKRRIILQIQGKFKRKPTGKVMFGAEISRKMKVGLLTKGILGLLIRLLENFFSDLRYSFGDSDGDEWPRIVAPAHSSFDSLVVTPPGDAPPQFTADPFEEAKEAKSKRKKMKGFEWNDTDTYSMSYYSMYVDFPTWQLLNLPVAGDMDLRSVWDNSFLRVVIYEKVGKQRPHLQALNNYFVGIQIAYTGTSDDCDENMQGIDLGELDEVATRSRRFEAEDFSDGCDSDSACLDRSESRLLLQGMEFSEEDDESLAFFDAEDGGSLATDARSPASNSIDVLLSIDTIVPAWFDVADRNGYVRTYAIRVGSKLSFRSVQTCETLVKRSGVERAICRTVEKEFSTRLSSPERMRRILGLSLLQGDQATLTAFKNEKSSFDEVFLSRKERAADSSSPAYCLLARAVSDRHWIEEVAKLTSKHISFYNPDQKKRSHIRIKLASIIICREVESNLLPFGSGFYFAVIETSGRSVYVMFTNEGKRSSWLKAVDVARTQLQVDDRVSEASHESDALPIIELDDPTDEFLHKSSMWNCKQRRVLNCGQFCFQANRATDPLKAAENALALALDPALEDDRSLRRSFLSTAAKLKAASPRHLSEDERLAFFLNVYHTMINHAFLVLGPPGSSLKWISYFNNIAYEVGDDIFSLTELEHCIIRANMSYPSQFVSRFVLPKSRYRYALVRSDYRINFALNPGSTSNPGHVFVYKSSKIDEQLDAASRLYLRSTTVSLKGVREVSIQLPRICQWFSEDFGDTQALMSKIEVFLADSERAKLTGCWLASTREFDVSGISIKYKNFSFQCRPLSAAP